MRIRLTYSCTGTTLPYPSYSLFAFSPDVRAAYVRASAFGRRKRIGRGRFGEERGDERASESRRGWREREYVYQPGTVYKVDRDIIMFARLSNALAFQIDSSGHWSLILKRRRHAYLLTFSFAALPPPRTYISSTPSFLVPFPLVACSTTQLPFQTFRESTHQILTDSRPTRIGPERTINSLVSTSKRWDSFVSRDNPPLPH